MNNDDIDGFLEEKWAEVFNPSLSDDELIRGLIKLSETEQNIAYLLRFLGKFYFAVGNYEQALAYLTKLLEFEPNNTFALKYRAETYHMIGKYENLLLDLNTLIEIDASNSWVLNTYEEINREYVYDIVYLFIE